MEGKKKTNLVLVDDHVLIRKGVAEIISKFEDYSVIWEASNGQEFINMLQVKPKPEIVVLDISMPVMDGYETARYLRKNNAEIKILVLSMHSDEETIIKMVKAGIHGYVIKDSDPQDFKNALDEVRSKGTSYTGYVSETLAKNIGTDNNAANRIKISERERQFLELVPGDLTYKEIADRLGVSKRTVDKYRDSLLSKLNVKRKASLVIYSLKNGIYKE